MGKRACHRGLSARWPFCFDDRRCEKSRDCAETVGTAGDRSSGKGNASGQAARRGTAGGLIKPGAGDCGVPRCPDRHWCGLRQFFAGLRRGLLAGLQAILAAETRSRRCASCAQPGSSPATGTSPRPGSGRQGGTQGHSDVAAAKRRYVGIAHAERRNPTGGFEKNNPSTDLADGAGELAAESGGGAAADDFQHRRPVDDIRHPASESAHAGYPCVAKSTPAGSSSGNCSGKSSGTSQARRPRFGRGRSAESGAGRRPAQLIDAAAIPTLE